MLFYTAFLSICVSLILHSERSQQLPLAARAPTFDVKIPIPVCVEHLHLVLWNCTNGLEDFNSRILRGHPQIHVQIQGIQTHDLSIISPKSGKRIVHFCLINTMLKTLPTRFFFNEPNIKVLNLSFNRFEHLESVMFSKFIHLERLLLNDNPLRIIDGPPIMVTNGLLAKTLRFVDIRGTLLLTSLGVPDDERVSLVWSNSIPYDSEVLFADCKCSKTHNASCFELTNVDSPRPEMPTYLNSYDLDDSEEVTEGSATDSVEDYTGEIVSSNYSNNNVYINGPSQQPYSQIDQPSPWCVVAMEQRRPNSNTSTELLPSSNFKTYIVLIISAILCAFLYVSYKKLYVIVPGGHCAKPATMNRFSDRMDFTLPRSAVASSNNTATIPIVRGTPYDIASQEHQRNLPEIAVDDEMYLEPVSTSPVPTIDESNFDDFTDSEDDNDVYCNVPLEEENIYNEID